MSAEAKPIYFITGFEKCRNYVRACQTLENVKAEKPELAPRYVKWGAGDREIYHSMRPVFLAGLGMQPDDHKTSPLVFQVDEQLKPIKFIGGGDAFCALVQEVYDVEPAPLGPKLE